jgi:hypothetical protein
MAILYQDSGSFYNLEVTSSFRATGSLWGTASWAENALMDIAATNSTNVNVSQLFFGTVGGNVSFGLNGGTITATAPAGGGGALNISASNTSLAVSTLVFSNANGISFGISTGATANIATITATATPAAGATFSTFDAAPYWTNTATSTFNASQLLLNPFVLPVNVSFSYLRVPATFNWNSQTLTTNTAAGSTFAQYTKGHTWIANLYTASAGGNLTPLYTNSATAEYRISITNTNNSYTANQYLTFPVTGSTATFFTSQNSNGAVISINTSWTGLVQSFTGAKWLDIPFNTSIPAGNYVIGIYRSTSQATNAAGASGLTAATFNDSLYLLTQATLTIGQMGLNTTERNRQFKPYLGLFTNTYTTVTAWNTATISTANISTAANHPIIPFQLIRDS